MSLKITEKDVSIFTEVATLCTNQAPAETVEKAISTLSTLEIQRCALTMYYHPERETPEKQRRFQSIAKLKQIEEQEDFAVRELSDLLFKRIWCFKRDTFNQKGQEICIQYARKKDEHPFLERLFGLKALCKHSQEVFKNEDCQFSFWSPNFDDESLFCWSRDNRHKLDGPEWSYGSDPFTRLPKTDGRWGLDESNHPQRGRKLGFCEVNTGIDLDDSVKRFTPCTLGEICNILAQLPKKRVRHRLENIRTEDLVHCKLYESNILPRQYLLIDRSSQKNPESFCRYGRVLIQREGVWVERPITSDESIPGLGDHIHLGSWMDTLTAGNTECEYTKLGYGTSKYTKIGFPKDPSPTLGMEYEESRGGFGFNQLRLRTISPMMVCPEEAEAMARFAQEFLQRMGLSRPLFMLMWDYLYLQGNTLPQDW